MDELDKLLMLQALKAQMPDGPEKTMFERQLEAIQAMPEEARAAAIEDMTRDYAGRTDAAQREQEMAYGDMQAAMEMPQSRVAGPDSNPFAVAIAPNALEYAAQGLRAYDAGKRGRKARSDLEALSQGQEGALGGVFGAGVTPARREDALAQKLREQEEERRRGLFRT